MEWGLMNDLRRDIASKLDINELRSSYPPGRIAGKSWSCMWNFIKPIHTAYLKDKSCPWTKEVLRWLLIDCEYSNERDLCFEAFECFHRPELPINDFCPLVVDFLFTQLPWSQRQLDSLLSQSATFVYDISNRLLDRGAVPGALSDHRPRYTYRLATRRICCVMFKVRFQCTLIRQTVPKEIMTIICKMIWSERFNV
jgi:hypothetical protein